MKSLKSTIFILFLSIAICAIFVLIKINCKDLYLDKNLGFAKIVNASEVENIFIGSSMFNKGLDMEIINNKSSEKTFLLTYNANQPFQIEHQINALLKNGVSPKRIFIDMYAYSVTARPSLGDKRLYLDLDYTSSKAIFDEIYKDLSFIEKAKKRYTLFVRLNNEYFLFYPILAYTNSTQAKELSTSAVNKGKNKDELDSLKIPDNLEKTEMDAQQKQAILNIKELAEKNNIELNFIETPKYTSIYKDANYISIMQEYKKFLDDNNIKYILFEDENFCNTPQHFIDLIHLSNSGRNEFSNIILNEITKNSY